MRNQETLERAKEEFAEMASEATRNHADRLVQYGVAEWVYDPEVLNTFGLVLKGTKTALVVIYGPVPNTASRERWDFELSDSFEEGMTS